jgi:hypothetical protein
MATRLRLLLNAAIAVTTVLGFVFPNPQPHFWWQKLPVFDAFFGFFGCILIIVSAKWLGHHWLMKDEDYYNHD